MEVSDRETTNKEDRDMITRDIINGRQHGGFKHYNQNGEVVVVVTIASTGHILVDVQEGFRHLLSRPMSHVHISEQGLRSAEMVAQRLTERLTVLRDRQN